MEKKKIATDATGVGELEVDGLDGKQVQHSEELQFHPDLLYHGNAHRSKKGKWALRDDLDKEVFNKWDT